MSIPPPNDNNYTDLQLRIALASLAKDDTTNSLNESCGHLFGYNNNYDNSSGDDQDGAEFFANGHELSKLQKITAHICLVYQALLVSMSIFLP